jgi:hypothetical protein
MKNSSPNGSLGGKMAEKFFSYEQGAEKRRKKQ